MNPNLLDRLLDVALRAMATDAQLLDQGLSPVTIANSQLWPGQIPDWVSSSWGELRFTLLDADEDWHVWTNWYEERLAGVATNQDIEVARLRIDDKIWEQQPGIVNSQIKELIEERGIFQHAIAEEPDDGLPDADVIPEQAGGASQFTLDAEGRIDLVPDPPSLTPLVDETQRELFEEMRHKALALASVGHNRRQLRHAKAGAKNVGSSFLKQRLPRCDLVRVDVKMLRKLSQRHLTLDGGYRHLRLEGRCVVPAGSPGHCVS
jgi:hypothetical protein